MNPASDQALWQLLINKKILSSEQYQALQAEAQTSGREILDLLIQKNILPEEELVRLEGEVLNVPYVDLTGQEVPAEVLNIVAQELAENYQMVPWRKQGSEVDVALLNPQDFKAIEALDFLARQQGRQFNFFITSRYSLRHVLRQYENIKEEVAEALKGAGSFKEEEVNLAEEEEAAKKVKTAPVSKTTSVILRHAIEGGASDVHIEAVPEGTRVRYRLDGQLHTSLMLSPGVHDSLVARIKVLANLKLDETRVPQDGRFKMIFEKREIEFRVSTLPLLNKEKVVIRILDTSRALKDLAGLGFCDRNLEIMQQNIYLPHGMFLVTGPTGSGKSTTLYAILKELNKEKVNIITLEDPVEYDIPGVAQAQMKPEVGLTFASGLRSVLRQDPDIIMVGEIRDNETAELAVHAALTGHMVLSTLHTNNAFGAIPRLVDMKVEPFLISSSLNIVVAQRLVRQICPHCKKETKLAPPLIAEIKAEIVKMPRKFFPKDIDWHKPWNFYAGQGCSHCEQAGYAGRIVISEVLEVTESLKQIIASGEVSKGDLLSKEFKKQGMFTMRQDGIIKALRGLVAIEEVWQATKD